MGTRPTLMGTEAAIATGHPLSASLGLEVMRSGGNAVDAAVAAALVEGLCNPHMLSFGGELMALVTRRGEVHCVDGNTVAPRDATVDWFRSRGHERIPRDSILSAGPPGTPMAVCQLLARFGTWTFGQVASRAIALAEDGFPAHHGLCGPEPDAPEDLTISGYQERFRGWPSTARIYLPDNQVPVPGQRLRNPDLARLWRAMAEAEKSHSRISGLEAAARVFYQEAPAERIALHSQQGGGPLRLEDLHDYHCADHTPVSGRFRGCEVFKCDASTQGPVMLQMLSLLDGFELPPPDSVEYVHLLAECIKLAFADREQFYGDVGLDVALLLAPEYAAARRGLFDPKRGAPIRPPGDPAARQAVLPGSPHAPTEWGGGTVAIAAVDRGREMVSLIPSGAWIGWSPVVEGLGIPLGTRISFMNFTPGHPNALVPGRRPRTTLSPTLVMREGRPFLSVGTSGGDQQDQWNLQTLLGIVAYGKSVQQAIEMPHFSTVYFLCSFGYQPEPGKVHLESRFGEKVAEGLRALGHEVQLRGDYAEGRIQCALYDAAQDMVHCGSDPRPWFSPHLPCWGAVW